MVPFNVSSCHQWSLPELTVMLKADAEAALVESVPIYLNIAPF